MNRTETAALLAVIAAYDQRTVGETDVNAWHDIIGDLPATDAYAAVRRFFTTWKSGDDRIRPGDVINYFNAAQVVKIASDWDRSDDPHCGQSGCRCTHGGWTVADGPNGGTTAACFQGVITETDWETTVTWGPRSADPGSVHLYPVDNVRPCGICDPDRYEAVVLARDRKDLGRRLRARGKAWT